MRDEVQRKKEGIHSPGTGRKQSSYYKIVKEPAKILNQFFANLKKRGGPGQFETFTFLWMSGEIADFKLDKEEINGLFGNWPLPNCQYPLGQFDTGHSETTLLKASERTKAIFNLFNCKKTVELSFLD